MTLDTILENARLLLTEARYQVKMTCGLLNDFSDGLLEKIAAKDDYIDNLKTTVENHCFSKIHGRGHMDEKEVNAVRSLHVICTNLERICDFCVNIARQTHYLSDRSVMHRYDYPPMFTEIQKGLERIIRVFRNQDLSGALEICRTEFTLDQMYKTSFDQIMAEIREGKGVEDLITVIFIFRYLERIGDSLLNVGEALIFAIIGDRIKIRQFEALQKTLTESGFEGTLGDIDFNSIWGSRSGCRIGKVEDKRIGRTKAQGIFKEGIKKKIKLERENIKRWEEIYPGLAPRVFGYYERRETASMLIEFLSGCTLDQVLLTESEEILGNVLFIFEQTLGEVWESTLRRHPLRTDYMEQLQSRLEAVRRVHPHFIRNPKGINGMPIQSSQELIAACGRVERSVQAPLTVFIHGDFNVNNIVYNHDKETINYIDLYRSRDADYVQDASVFLVSNFRLPVFEPRIRGRLNEVILHFYRRFLGFADAHRDETFQVRMALALARSFYTSSRFELNFRFAKDMYHRAHYLMERMVGHADKPWEAFRLPLDVLIY